MFTLHHGTMRNMLCVTCHVSHVKCHMSCVTCQVSHVTCHMSGVTCHVSYVRCQVSGVRCHMLFFLCFFGQTCGASRWRVSYQRGLLRLVSLYTGQLSGQSKLCFLSPGVDSKNGKRFSFVASNVGFYLMLLFSSVKRVEIIVKQCDVM